MAFFTPQDCGCCDGCPVLFFISDCRLYWTLFPLPDEPYTVTINTPTGTEVYDSISSGLFETPSTGTYSGYVTKDGVDSAICTIDIVACTPVNPCCVRTSGINIRITSNTNFAQWKGGRVQSGTFYGAYAEATLPNWNEYSVRTGARSSGAKTDSNCYDLWGVPDFSSFVDVAKGSGTISFYSGYTGYANAAAVPCSIPTTSHHYLKLYFDYYLRYTNDEVIFRGSLTAYDRSALGGGTAPSTPTVGTQYTFASIPWGLCAADVAIVTPLPGNIHSPNLNLAVCNGADDTVVGEWWPDVIPL